MTEGFWSFVLSTAGVVTGVVAKSFWDRFLANKEEIARLQRNKKLEILERQLSEFYSPILIRLEKDNQVWLKVFEQKDNPLSSEVRRNLELNFLLPNHDEIMEIIESKIHLARADKRLSQEISNYIRHIAIYKALRQSNVFDKDPYTFGEPYPKDLFHLLETEKERLQTEFDRLLNLERRSS